VTDLLNRRYVIQGKENQSYCSQLAGA
jgi:hypothetical protein